MACEVERVRLVKNSHMYSGFVRLYSGLNSSEETSRVLFRGETPNCGFCLCGVSSSRMRFLDRVVVLCFSCYIPTSSSHKSPRLSVGKGSFTLGTKGFK